MLIPASNDAILGRDEVVAGLRAVEAACDKFRHTHLLAVFYVTTGGLREGFDEARSRWSSRGG
jgi:hypothetical protein